MEEQGQELELLWGTMIELPRAALVAGEIAEVAEFFSFGTNDLTQTAFGFSRDDIGKFLGLYEERKLVPANPFVTIDQPGVGRLMQIACEEGRAVRREVGSMPGVYQLSVDEAVAEAAAAACGYAMLYGLIVGRGEFVRQLLPTAMRAMNLTGVILFLIGSVGVFQFLAANMYWPQRITDTITGWGLTPLGFIFAYMGVLLILGMFVDGVAMILLTVPVIFPVAYAMKIDPVALGIMLTLNIEMGVVTPPVGLNLFAVSGTSKISLPEVIKGTLPFFVGDGIVLLLVIFFPELATWLPDLLVKDVFK